MKNRLSLAENSRFCARVRINVLERKRGSSDLLRSLARAEDPSILDPQKKVPLLR
ncbi:hypothetical protein [Teichococcus wenyumeiae]|uniref:hypothetical protein n=1 Tax=Teichococcus wenyumeiae TaxID=2478470 RepID=UPI0013150276|nr:hypothetical protein [Pseudoroseomonas wenyumeiae]